MNEQEPIKTKRTRRDVGGPEAQKDPIFLFQRKGNFGQWDAEYVFFTREEAEEWGTAYSYRYRRGGWRVYCVSAMGELADVLRMPEQQTTDPIEKILGAAPKCGRCGKHTWMIRYSIDGFTCTDCLNPIEELKS